MQPSEIVRGDIMLEWSGKHPTIEREREREREERALLIGFSLKGPTETLVVALGRSDSKKCGNRFDSLYSKESIVCDESMDKNGKTESIFDSQESE